MIQEIWQSSNLWTQNCAKARTLLERVVAVDGDNNLALTCLGAVLSDQGSHLEAVQVLRKAVSNGSRDRNTYFNLAVAVMHTAARGEAKRWFRKAEALKADPESWEAYFDPHGH
jgi:Tfp pilus assembly protein PilF